MLLLDTTVLIDSLRGRPAAHRLRALRNDDVPYACAINVEEVMRGIFEHETRAVSAFLAGLRIVSLGFDEGEMAGTWRREYAERGVTLSQADCLVAAASVSIGATLATGNPTDFPMPEVTVEHWPVGL
jgi:predicted nucleic acid-binding protein